jgi:hypothetical protein
MAAGVSATLWSVRRSNAPVRQGAFLFKDEWADKVRTLPETGMGYTMVCITLRDGQQFDAIIDSGWLSCVRARADVPFAEADITAIKPTHEKWRRQEGC